MDSYALKLEEWQSKNLMRTWRTFDKAVLNFSSNDYLGLASDERLKQAAIDAIMKYGVGSTSSRAVYGSLSFHQELEEKLARFTHHDKALLFSSGYQANSTLLKTLGDEKTLYLLDHNCHRSLIEGASNSSAKMVRFRHNDPNHLAHLLKKMRPSFKRCWIVTESLFSMDGDFAPLNEIISLKNEHGAYLMVDEAHALGLFGKQGEGLGKGADLTIGAFGKAFGSFGAFAASHSLIIDYLRQFCPGLIYTTALPPPLLGSIDKALEMIPSMDRERAHLLSLSPSPIIPIPIDDPLECMKRCEERGIIVHAIRPPTVSKPIIRLSLTAKHTHDDLQKVRNLIREIPFPKKDHPPQIFP